MHINNINITKQDKTKENNKRNNTEQRKMDQLKFFRLEHELLKYLCIYKLHSQQEHAELNGSAGGATERGEVWHIPNGNMIADCFEDRGVIFNVSKDI
jgi:hypothetical protein